MPEIPALRAAELPFHAIIHPVDTERIGLKVRSAFELIVKIQSMFRIALADPSPLDTIGGLSFILPDLADPRTPPCAKSPILDAGGAASH
jgi:hypothetical protein